MLNKAASHSEQRNEKIIETSRKVISSDIIVKAYRALGCGTNAIQKMGPRDMPGRFVGRWLSLLSVVVLVGCAGNEASLTKLENDAVILAFGDSLTYGTGVSQEKSYPTRLAEKTGLKVVNAGVPGEVTEWREAPARIVT